MPLLKEEVMNQPTRIPTRLLSFTVAVLFGSLAQAQQEAPALVVSLPDSIKWGPNPVIPGALAAVLIGNPTKAEPYLVRLKFPDDYRVMPHTHPDHRVYTVLSGNFRTGVGKKFDESKLKELPAGTAFLIPANVPHFNLIKGETIVQYSSVGPTSTMFSDPADDPRKK